MKEFRIVIDGEKRFVYLGFSKPLDSVREVVDMAVGRSHLPADEVTRRLGLVGKPETTIDVEVRDAGCNAPWGLYRRLQGPPPFFVRVEDCPIIDVEKLPELRQWVIDHRDDLLKFAKLLEEICDPQRRAGGGEERASPCQEVRAVPE